MAGVGASEAVHVRAGWRRYGCLIDGGNAADRTDRCPEVFLEETIMSRVQKSGTSHVTQPPSTTPDPAPTLQTPVAQVWPRSTSLPLQALKALKSVGQLAIGPMRIAAGAVSPAKLGKKPPRRAPAEDYVGSLRDRLGPRPPL